MSLKVDANLRITPTLTKANALIATGLSATPSINEQFNLTDGTAAGQADRAYTAQLTLSGTTPQNLDLTALTNIFGDAITFVKVKMAYFKAALANTQAIKIGNGTTPFIGPFGAAGASEYYLPAGGHLWLTNPAGWVVTPTTAMILKLVGAGAGTHVVDVELFGTSA